ncbi:MAG: hypothetical protein NZ534_05575 [Bacteroidia bacterium]|nr:hypothetical protein [Bacteroidia bacterium]
MESKSNRPELSPSSRFNIRFMRRTNILAITMFLGGIIYKLIEWLSR